MTKPYTPATMSDLRRRLNLIAEIIERGDTRKRIVDGPISDVDLAEIYRIATGVHQRNKQP